MAQVCLRPEAEVRDFAKADVRVAGNSLRRQHYWPCYTDSRRNGLCSINDLPAGTAVSINKNFRTPASFYYLLGVTKKRRSGVRDINQETASCL
jgi:hypothetical protein